VTIVRWIGSFFMVTTEPHAPSELVRCRLEDVGLGDGFGVPLWRQECQRSAVDCRVKAYGFRFRHFAEDCLGNLAGRIAASSIGEISYSEDPLLCPLRCLRLRDFWIICRRAGSRWHQAKALSLSLISPRSWFTICFFKAAISRLGVVVFSRVLC